MGGLLMGVIHESTWDASRRDVCIFDLLAALLLTAILEHGRWCKSHEQRWEGLALNSGSQRVPVRVLSTYNCQHRAP